MTIPPINKIRMQVNRQGLPLRGRKEVLRALSSLSSLPSHVRPNAPSRYFLNLLWREFESNQGISASRARMLNAASFFPEGLRIVRSPQEEDVFLFFIGKGSQMESALARQLGIRRAINSVCVNISFEPALPKFRVTPAEWKDLLHPMNEIRFFKDVVRQPWIATARFHDLRASIGMAGVSEPSQTLENGVYTASFNTHYGGSPEANHFFVRPRLIVSFKYPESLQHKDRLNTDNTRYNYLREDRQRILRASGELGTSFRERFLSQEILSVAAPTTISSYLDAPFFPSHIDDDGLLIKMITRLAVAHQNINQDTRILSRMEGIILHWQRQGKINAPLRDALYLERSLPEILGRIWERESEEYWYHLSCLRYLIAEQIVNDNFDYSDYRIGENLGNLSDPVLSSMGIILQRADIAYDGALQLGEVLAFTFPELGLEREDLPIRRITIFINRFPSTRERLRPIAGPLQHLIGKLQTPFYNDTPGAFHMFSLLANILIGNNECAKEKLALIREQHPAYYIEEGTRTLEELQVNFPDLISNETLNQLAQFKRELDLLTAA